MSRPKITVTNVGKDGKVSDSKWFVRVGEKWRTFDQAGWVAGGVEWINSQVRLHKQ